MLNVKRSIQCAHKSLHLIRRRPREPGKPRELCHPRPSPAKVNLQGRMLPLTLFSEMYYKQIVKQDSFAADDTFTENCSAKYVKQKEQDWP